MRAVGGIPITRHQRRNMVDQMLQAFAERDELALVVPVEATRARTEHWKSGFYHIASQAGVPIVMGYLDYSRKRGGFGPSLTPSGDLRRDMDELRAFYEPIVGKHPAEFGPVRLEKEI
jgi:1-acyl-sn-glycerol-3-phosphate acyltransferase